MSILYFFIGFLSAIIAAIPPGAANIYVVNTSIKNTVNKAMTIIIGAAIGEVILSYIALHCSMVLNTYFKENPWIQIMVFILFFLVGLFFLFRKKLKLSSDTLLKIKVKPSKLISGFLLAFLNPPVLIFWLVAFALIHKHILMVTDMSPWIVLLLLFTGVFFGKLATLYGYGRWGKQIDEGKKDSKYKLDLFIGIALLIVSIIQSVRFFIN